MARPGLGADHLVDGIADADAEEVIPDAVDRGPGEVRVVRRGDPVGQRLARRLLELPLRDTAVEELRLHDALGAGDGDLLAVRGLVPRNSEVALVLPLQPREEGSVLPELLALPVGEGVMMALGTLQAH